MKKSKKHEESLLYTLNKLKNLDYIDEIWLYGSYARKNFRMDSDIDLYLVIKDKKFNNPKNQRFIKNETISDDFRLPEIDLHFGNRSIKEYKQKEDYEYFTDYLFISNIKKDGILLWEKN